MNSVFEERYKAIDKIAGRINLKPALRQTKELVREFPHEPKARYLLNLLLCLCGDFSSVATEEAEQYCPDFDPLVHGDMQRDRIIGIARYGTVEDFDLAYNDLEPAIRKVHAKDSERLACLESALGQLAYAQGQHELAMQYHLRASALRTSLGPHTDKEGIELNMVYWLRVIVAMHGCRTQQANELWSLLRQSERANHAKIIRIPFIGVRMYDWLHQHRTLPLPL